MMPVLEQRGDYWISTDTALLDFFVIHRFIAEESYWGKGRTAEIMQRAIDHSAILRFLAPTAFETRSIEEILEGGSR